MVVEGLDQRTADAALGKVPGADLDLLAALDGPLFQEMVAVSAPVLGAPCGAIVLMAGDGVWLRSRIGFPDAESARRGELWDAAMTAEGPFVVEDLLADPRFAAGPRTVGGIEARFFASSTFHSQDGHPIGLYCAVSPEPMALDPGVWGLLSGLAAFIEGQIAGMQEFDRAAEVQRSLFPEALSSIPGYEIAGSCVPAKSVGGDFFDWFEIEDGFAVTLADVMGKGVGAGIIAATVRATIRTARRDENVVVAVERAAEALEEDLSETGAFVTLFHARVHGADGHVSFADAGHGLTVVVDADGTARRLSTDDLPLGASLGTPQPLHEQHVVIEKGGTLVSCSDGVLDLYDGSLDSMDRVADIARAASSAQGVVDEIERLARRDGAPDDVTVVAIRRLP